MKIAISATVLIALALYVANYHRCRDNANQLNQNIPVLANEERTGQAKATLAFDDEFFSHGEWRFTTNASPFRTMELPCAELYEYCDKVRLVVVKGSGFDMGKLDGEWTVSASGKLDADSETEQNKYFVEVEVHEEIVPKIESGQIQVTVVRGSPKEPPEEEFEQDTYQGE